jgi:hypothetical protein
MRFTRVATIPLLAGMAACKLGNLVGANQLPSGTVDPSTFQNPTGAMAMYENAMYTFQYAQVTTQSVGGTSGAATGSNGAFVDYMLQSGVFTDELHAGNLGGPPGGYSSLPVWDSVDARTVNATGNPVGAYFELQNVRGASTLAIEALTAYDPTAPSDLRGQLYALRGYAIVLMAEFYCSGVPLSTISLGGDYTYAPGSTTPQLYQAAIAQFDTAITLSPDSIRVQNLARVGLARAELGLGQYAAAAQAVTLVPDNFQYQFNVDWSGANATTSQGIFSSFGSSTGATVADQEGGNGLPFISSGDPRSAVQVAETSPNLYGDPQYIPVKYGGAARSIMPITVADGTEARLIEAEAAYQAQNYGTWLSKLNEARSIVADTLPPLTDPGADAARVTLMFQERAYDLFLTGHRQGDLRRLVSQYHLPQNQVYPTGQFPSAVPEYGSDVTVPVPNGESVNPLWGGCFNRGA